MSANSASGWAFRCRRRGCRRSSPSARRSICLRAFIGSRGRRKKCSRNSNSRKRPTRGWGNFLEDSGSGWRWRPLWCAIRRFCFSTSRRQLWDIIREFQRGGGTVLLTTHYMDEAERLCDRLAIVDHGQIIAEGSPAELIERLGGHHVV